ncbi:hypothetical protein V1511DRAFT_486547 [Dipodascopsis uninucleata]
MSAIENVTGLDLTDSPRPLSDQFLPPGIGISSMESVGSQLAYSSIDDTARIEEHRLSASTTSSLSYPQCIEKAGNDFKDYGQSLTDNRGTTDELDDLAMTPSCRTSSIRSLSAAKSPLASPLLDRNFTIEEMDISGENLSNSENKIHVQRTESNIYDSFDVDSSQKQGDRTRRIGSGIDIELVSSVNYDKEENRVRDTTIRLQSMLSNTSIDDIEEDEELQYNTSPEDVLADRSLSESQKQEALQHMFMIACSSGEHSIARKLLEDSMLRNYIDIDKPDDEGTCSLIYAACFGHDSVVKLLVENGANIDQQDGSKWSPLMWATNNNHKSIVKYLIDHGASLDVQSATGRTVRDFVNPASDVLEMVSSPLDGPRRSKHSSFGSGKHTKSLMEHPSSAMMTPITSNNLYRSKSDINIQSKSSEENDSQPETDANLRLEVEEFEKEGDFYYGSDMDNTDDGLFEENQEFEWDHCLPDQMFVFSAEDIPKILDVAISRVQPLRASWQKAVPANMLFLCTRFAHYYGNEELLKGLFASALTRVQDIVETNEDDVALLSFWLSNTTLLLYYLKRDPGVLQATTEYQQILTELVSEIFVLIIRDSERRLDSVLDAAILDYETIPGLDDVQFQREWNIFRSTRRSPQALSPSLDSRALPGSETGFSSPVSQSSNFHHMRSPDLSSSAPKTLLTHLNTTLYTLDLYDVHPIIEFQIIGQIFYWINATLFNRIMADRKYLARSRAMQIRLNLSMLEEWAQTNNRKALIGDSSKSGVGSSALNETIVELSRRHLSPVVQLLQWLQCFSSLGDGIDSLESTLNQLSCLTPPQLIHAVNRYRPEVGESRISKTAMKYLRALDQQQSSHKRGVSTPFVLGSNLLNQILPPSPVGQRLTSPSRSPSQGKGASRSSSKTRASKSGASRRFSNDGYSNGESNEAGTLAMDGTIERNGNISSDDEQVPWTASEYLDISLILPFMLPTVSEMIVVWDSPNVRQKYAPFLPPEFVAKLDATSSLSTGIPSMKSGVTGSGDNRGRENSIVGRTGKIQFGIYGTPQSTSTSSNVSEREHSGEVVKIEHDDNFSDSGSSVVSTVLYIDAKHGRRLTTFTKDKAKNDTTVSASASYHEVDNYTMPPEDAEKLRADDENYDAVADMKRKQEELEDVIVRSKISSLEQQLALEQELTKVEQRQNGD